MKTRSKKTLARRALWGLGGGLVAVATGFQLVRLGYEEPAYEVIASDGPLEVRRYAPRVVAETVVGGSERDATREGFRRLAGYIFGGNDGGASIDMTTPVERAPSGTSIDMTTPVERAPSPEGWVVAFTMPSDRSLATLPRPNDARVTLREVPGRTVAVLSFRGRADAATSRREAAALLEHARARGFEPEGEPSLAQYDPPWVLGPLRRNEVHCEVRPRT